MAENTFENSGSNSKQKYRPDRFSLQRALELLSAMDGDTSDLDLSDNDDDILDASYQPQPQEQSSSEDENSGDEYPIPQPTEQSRGRKRLRGEDNDLALANSWLLYRKDLATCGAPRKSIMQFLEFRIDVARTFLAQHHSQEDDADFPELSEGEDDSLERKKRPVMAVPHVSVRRRANAHLPEMVNMKNAARCRAAGCTGRTRVRCVTCKVFLCLQTERNCFLEFHK
ncbi:hypothetical protein D4764_09G0000920 [Takifugu flavidus]|uniref:PiggyBac transposable element-derived protein domain-containing protein n=1 Tax=Takifugu flavidus TaxID=433684 RepID=A0A5C6MJK8_9TELE|nr:hypothetical protein D4764_09G0000920 [Takifugu flavidus]